jgi:hypothetical protein
MKWWKAVAQIRLSGNKYTMDLVRKGVFEQTGMAPAHMIHSSSEGRFSITYAVDPKNISPEEMRQVGYEYMDVREALHVIHGPA